MWKQKLVVGILFMSFSFSLRSHEKNRDYFLALYQMMKDIHELFDEIPYWVDSGTFIGAVRHEGIIPWDDDLDLCISVNSLPLLYTLRPYLKELGYELRHVLLGECIYKSEPPHVWADIFPMRHVGNNIHFLHPSAGFIFGKGREIIYNVAEVYPLKKYRFGLLEVWGPCDPDAYLFHFYGTAWRQVPRIWNHGRIMCDYREIINRLPKTGVWPCAQPTGPLEDRVLYEKKELR